MGCCPASSSGDGLLAAAAAASIALAKGKTAEELELLSAFFDVLGNNLTLLALYAPSGSGDC